MGKWSHKPYWRPAEKSSSKWKHHLLKEAISSDNGLIQTAAISSFGELGDTKAVPLLVPYCTNPDWQVRYRVVQALTRLNSEDAKAILANLVNDEVEAISHEAKKALQLV